MIGCDLFIIFTTRLRMCSCECAASLHVGITNECCYARKYCYASEYCSANAPDQLRERNAHMEIWLRVNCFV